MHTHLTQDELLLQVEKMSVNVRCIRNVHAVAIRSYNARKSELDPAATKDSERDFLDRITVNFIRHELTTYDSQLDEVATRIGATKARNLIKIRVLQAIAQAYPFLEHECKQQVPQ